MRVRAMRMSGIGRGRGDDGRKSGDVLPGSSLWTRLRQGGTGTRQWIFFSWLWLRTKLLAGFWQWDGLSGSVQSERFGLIMSLKEMGNKVYLRVTS